MAEEGGLESSTTLLNGRERSDGNQDMNIAKKGVGIDRNQYSIVCPAGCIPKNMNGRNGSLESRDKTIGVIEKLS